MQKTIDILRDAWKETLTTDYPNGILYIERDLQAAFYHHVRNISRDKLKLFNEAPDFLGQGKPDLVVCRDEAVEAVIEFKFAPKFRDDIAKLARWANIVSKDQSEMIYLALDPKKVEIDRKRPFIVSAKTNWIFAVVEATGWDAVSSAAVKECLRPKRKNVPWSRFWHFTGVAGSKGKPRIAARHL